MTSRERVLAATHHQVPDRLPIDLGGMRSTGIMAGAYAALKQHLGITEGDIRIYDPGQQLAIVEESVRQRLQLDVICLDGGTFGPWRDYTLSDGTAAKIGAGFITQPDGRGGEFQLDADGHRVRHRPAQSHYFDPLCFPLEDVTSAAELERIEWPTLIGEDLRALQAEARRLHTETDYAIMGGFGGAFLEDAQFLRGWANFMMDIAGDPPFAEALLEKLLDHHLRNVELYLAAVGDYIQIIQMGGDLGAQAGPQVRPETYYNLIQPRQKRLWSRIHELAPGVSVFLHSCGGIYELIPGIIDAGCDILNPVQISAHGMDPARLKREFGHRLCFWGGGCDTQRILPFATPDEVAEHARGNAEIFGAGGGYVFCQVHNIQADVPPENILAMHAGARRARN